MAKKIGEKQKQVQKKKPTKSSFSKLIVKSKKIHARHPKNEEEKKSPTKKLKVVTQAKDVADPAERSTADMKIVDFGSSAEQLDYFLNAFQAGTRTKLSSLELQEISGNCMMKLSDDMDHSIQNLGKHVKAMFGTSWKDVLCAGDLIEGNVKPGSPAILAISSSAARCVEVLRGLREFTTNCHSAKLFAKHIKMEEQVSMLKGRVNIAGGTPSRIKSLIDSDALRISRLSVLLLDMHKDAKGLTLFNLPQVRLVCGDLSEEEQAALAETSKGRGLKKTNIQEGLWRCLMDLVKSRLTGSSRASDISFLQVSLMNGIMTGKVYDWASVLAERRHEFMTLQHKTFYMPHYAIGLFLDAATRMIPTNELEAQPRPLAPEQPPIMRWKHLDTTTGQKGSAGQKRP